MLCTVSSPFFIDFTRSGGSLITARIDVWSPTASEWIHVAEYIFSGTTSSTEKLQATLNPGNYTCIFQCYVEESLNGKYQFLLKVAGKDTFSDSGDVNTTPANNDSKVYKDQFALVVQ